MPKSGSSTLTERSGTAPAGKRVSSKKLVYASILRDRDRKITQDVQAALRSANADELLFKKA